MTGRGAGFCSGDDAPGFRGGRGFNRGFRFGGGGRGRGFGRREFWDNAPSEAAWEAGSTRHPLADEVTDLRAQLAALQAQLHDLQHKD